MTVAALPFLAMLAAGLPWVIVASVRLGLRLAVPLVGGTALFALMVLLLATRYTGWPPVQSVLLISAVVGVAGVAVAVWRRSTLRRPAARTLALWLGSLTGAVAWLVTLALTRVVPGASTFSWVMNGDGANNIHEALGYYWANGIIVEGSSPVLLIRSLLMISLSSGRADGQPLSVDLAHDLIALQTTWLLGLGATAIALGVLAGSLLRSSRVLPTLLASVTGSLLTMTWFVTGLPIEYGYLNSMVALPILIGCWLAFTQLRRAPGVVIGTLLGLTVLVLASWSALLVFPLALLVAAVVLERRRLLRLGLVPLIAIAVAGAAAAGWFLLTISDRLASQLEVLATAGHGVPSLAAIAIALGVITIVLARVTRLDGVLFAGTVAIAAATLVGIITLALAAPNAPDPLATYYSAKFAWMASVLGVGLLLAVALAALAPRLLAVVAFGVASILILSLGPAPVRQHYRVLPPAARILAGDVWADGNHSVDVILDTVTYDERHLLWNSGEPDEAYINFWLLDFEGAAPGEDVDLRLFSISAYRQYRDTGSYTPPAGTDRLCVNLVHLRGPIVVHTTDPALEAAVTAACPLSFVTFRLE